MTSHTRKIARFAANLKLSDVPDEVVARAKALVLDGLGCGLFAAGKQWTEIVAKIVHQLEPGGGVASVWGRGETASAVHAALVNGTMVQGYEIDDANQACFHACAIVLPAAFAAAEHVGADTVSGETLLTAIIAGFEVGPRVGLCMNGDRMIVKGWHAPGIFGPFSAALSAGIILGLDEEQLYHALGIAGTQASGLMAAQFGSMVKRMQCAKNAQSGLYAALLAAEGFTGIEDVFEQEYGGYCTTFTQTKDEFDLSELSKGLGTAWETMRIDLKRHASLGTNFASMDAVEALMVEEGLKPKDVEEIVVHATQATVSHGAWEYVPTGLTSAQMNMGFGIAMMLIEGRAFVDEMVDANIARPDLVELANRVRAERDEAREKMAPQYHRGSRVDVTLKDGRTLHKNVDFFVGSHHRPMTEEQVIAKFRNLAERSVSVADMDRIEDIVFNLEKQSELTTLSAILRGKGSSAV
ncbi:MmgE/PrpD family protein [Salipiger sp.]|uniref:MmgE/PrpD family protein n=1 Tax=Salipiger sp. TaxID=2078585 RepID=UPI003A971095